MVGDDLRVVAANRQVCPTISEISFGNLYKRLPAVPSELPDVEGARPGRLFSELVHKRCRVAWRGPSSRYGRRANLVWLQVRGRLEPRCRTESKPHPYRSANWENVQSHRQNCDSSAPSLQPSRSPGGPAPLRRPIAGG